ncbi:MAG: hypothetical protein C4570_04005 [Ammonifex sp.]|nr:MAG: hypothetical protein C4570_04005 [Ammonifex sp.]
MWSEFLSAEAEALSFFSRLPDLLWGVLLAVLSILAARLVFRAAVCSFFGRDEGAVLAALAEMAVALMMGLKFYQQPGVVFVLLGYFAAVARVFAAAL